jgi:hypothetical protein
VAAPRFELRDADVERQRRRHATCGLQ